MRQLRNTLTSIFLAASMILSPVCLLSADVQATDTTVNEQTGDKVTDDGKESIVYSVKSNSNHYTNWPSNTIQSYLVPLEGGKLMSINFGSYTDQVTGKTKKAMLAGYFYPDSENGGYKYDASASRTIGLEFPIFGGFHATDKYYFVLTAQSNAEHSNSKDIFRITKFDKNWTRLGSVELKNCNTDKPFAFGTARMATCGDYLLIRTCHNMYNGHQSNLTLQLNMETMQMTFAKPGYTSHSLNQFIKVDEDNHMVSVDIGDYYSRGVILNTYDGDLSKGIYGNSKQIRALKFKGSGVYTHATAGGFEMSDSSYLIAGSSIDQKPESTSNIMNIFLAAVNKETKEPEVKWLTNEDQTSFLTPHLVKISDKEFLMLWQKSNEDNIIYCSKVDGVGNPIPSGTEDNENGTENGAAGNSDIGTDKAREDDDRNTENKLDALTGYEIVKLPGKLTECAPIVVSGSSLVWTEASSDKNGTNLSLYEIKTEELKGNDTVSTSAIQVHTESEGIKYPVSTVETIIDNSKTDQTPGGADSSTGSGSSSGSAGGTGGWSSGMTSANQPFIQDSSGRYGWDAILAESTKAAAQGGGTVTVNMNGVYQIPRRVFESIRGKNVTLILYISQSIQWRVYGKDITAETLSDTNLYVRTGVGNIPQDAADHTADGLEYIKLSFNHNGAFGFPLTISVRLAKSNGELAIKSVNSDAIRMLNVSNGTADTYAGMYANLFFYHSDKRELEFASAGKIGEDGMADLSVTRGGDYLLIVSSKQMGGTEPSQNDNTTVTQPETPQQPEETVQPEVKSVKLSKTIYTYTGKEKKPSITAMDTNGQKISSKDYTVSYKNNKKVGKATATVKFKNSYSGTVKQTFTIRPAGTSIQKIAALSKGFTIKWKKKNVQTSGYQIQYSTNAEFKTGSSSKILVKKASVNKKTIKNLKAAKKYYVRIRTYKTVKVNGKNTKIYSKWSAAEKVKTV